MDSDLPGPRPAAPRLGTVMRLWKPGHAQHGFRGLVTRVEGELAYCEDGWHSAELVLDGWQHARSEAAYQRARAELVHPWVWRD